jgi:hypothetical protein
MGSWEFGAPTVDVWLKTDAARHQRMVLDTGDRGTVTMYTHAVRTPGPVVRGQAPDEPAPKETPLAVDWVMIGDARREAIVGGVVERGDDSRVPGCIGLGLLRTWSAAEFDFEHNELALYEKTGPAAANPRDHPIRVPLREGRANEVALGGVIQSRPCAVVIDSGFNGFAAASEELLRSLGHDTAAAEETTAVTPFRSYSARAVALDDTLRLGESEIRLTGPAMALDAQARSVLGASDLILGAQFLRQYRVVRIDWSRGELVLIK